MHRVVVVVPDPVARDLNVAALVDAVWAHAELADALEHATAERRGDGLVVTGYLIAESYDHAEVRFRAIVARATLHRRSD